MDDLELMRLKALAAEFRAAIARTKEASDDRVLWLGRFPDNCCDHACQLMFLFLYERGIRGFRRIEAEVPGREPPYDRHVWLEVDGMIIDITADQFAGQAEVIVARFSDWHSSLRIEERQSVGMEGEDENNYLQRLLSHHIVGPSYTAIVEHLFFP